MKGETKIIAEELEKFQSKSNLNLFGEWISQIKSLKKQYNDAQPFEHIIIPNFFNSDFANQIHDLFPSDFEKWHSYNNPIEVKYAYDRINELDEPLKKIFYILCTKEMIRLFSEITGIVNLEFDPFLHGAGLHAHPRNGRLHMHLDYEKHVYLEKERRVNLIYYVNKEWEESWNGETELWNKNMTECVTKSPVKFNTAILFKTNQISWHGLPERIQCPSHIFRKSIAFYYISDMVTEKDENIMGNDGSGFRTKAVFVKRPTDPDFSQMDELYKIRPLRRIESTDMERIWKEWTPELF